HLVHPEHLVVVEVRLHERAVGHGPALLERVADAEEQRALDLRTGAVGIHDDAAVHRAHDLFDLNLAARRIDARLDDRAGPAGRLLLLRADTRDATPGVGRQRRAPAGFLGRQTDHPRHPPPAAP